MSALLVGEFSAHPGRAIVNLLVIAIGVAMGYAVHLINQSALNEFSRAALSLQGKAELEIRGPRSGFDEALYPRIARLAEVAAASPIVETEAKIAGRQEPLRVLGIDVFRAAAVQPGLIGQAESAPGSNAPPPLLDPDAIFLSPAALSWLGVEVGQSLEIQVGLTAVPLRIAGTLPAAGAGVRIATMDIGAAQWRLGRVGVLSRIDVKLRQGVDPVAFRSRLNAMLPRGVVAETPRDTEQRVSGLSRAYRVNLNVLALVALFTGSFLVLSSQTLSVVRRRAELALLRVIGVTRAGVVRLLLEESVLIGSLGSVLGIAGGYLIARFILGEFGGDLGGGYFNGVAPAVRFALVPALIFFLLGITAAILGSVVPAIEAARARPARALKAGDEESALQRIRSPWPALLLIAAGAALTLAGPVAGLPLPGYLAIALLLIGGIGLVPAFAQGIFSRLPQPGQPIVRLAFAQLAAAPGRASLALAGIVASFSLLVAMGIMVASFRDSVDQWLGRILPADLYVRAAAGGETGFFSSEDVQRMRSVGGVERVEFLRVDQLILDPRRPPVALLGRGIDADNPAARLPIVGQVLTPRTNAAVPIWVSEPMVDLYGFTLGKTVSLPLNGRDVVCVVAGVWRDYARQHGAVVMRDTDYRRITGDRKVTDASLWLAPGATIEQVSARLRASLPGGEHLEFAVPGEIRARSLTIFDRSFAVTYLLEAVAILIGLTGVAASFGAQALARAREFGVLRHLGVTRPQIAAMLATEGALLALLGIGLGLALGGAISLILIHVVNPQSFHWTMDVHVPWRLLIAVAAVLLFAASVTAVTSGRRAMARGAVMAVREDW